MTEEVSAAATNEVLRPLDTGIPFLAMRAAVQLDNLILKKKKSVDAVERLGARLLQTADVTASAVSKKALIDPFAVRILRMVSQQTAKDAPTGADELMRQAKENAVKLSAAANRSATAKDLKMLRTYCLALSRVLSSYHQSRQDHLKPLHRVRR